MFCFFQRYVFGIYYPLIKYYVLLPSNAVVKQVFCCTCIAFLLLGQYTVIIITVMLIVWFHLNKNALKRLFSKNETILSASGIHKEKKKIQNYFFTKKFSTTDRNARSHH